MIHRFHFDQDELEIVCREPRSTPFEFNPVNSYYGHGEIMRHYAGLPHGIPLSFSVEHYVPQDIAKIHDYDFTPGLPGFLAVNQPRAEIYRQNGKPRPVVAGAAIHYARKLLEASIVWEAPAEHERHGTLAFPHKSTRLRDRSFDFDKFAEELIALPEEFQPVYVCIGWKDYQKGRDRPYRERGIPVVAAGHINDSLFLFRFIDLCSRFRYACGNAPGSCYPLSVTCGCHFFMISGGPVLERERGFPENEIEIPGKDYENGRRLLKAAPFPPTADSMQLQKEFVDELTGKQFVLQPEEIREIEVWSRQWLLENQSLEVDFVDGFQISKRNTWLATGISDDGWTGKISGITPGPASVGRNLFMRFEFPSWLHEGELHFEAEMPGKERIKTKMEPGYYELSTTVTSECVGKEIRFRASRDAPLSPEDNRRVAFRFLNWELSDNTPEVDWEFCRIEIPNEETDPETKQS